MNILGIEVSQDLVEAIGGVMTCAALVLVCWKTTGNGRLKYARRGIVEQTKP